MAPICFTLGSATCCLIEQLRVANAGGKPVVVAVRPIHESMKKINVCPPTL